MGQCILHFSGLDAFDRASEKVDLNSACVLKQGT